MKEIEFIKLLGKSIIKGGKPLAKVILNNGMAMSKGAMRLLKSLSGSTDDVISLLAGIAELDLDQVLSEVIDIAQNVDVPQLVKDSFKDMKSLIHDNYSTLKAAIDQSPFRLPIKNRKESEQKVKSKTNKQSRSQTSTKQTSRSSISKTNHPEWYMKDKTLLSSLVGINISNRTNALNEYMKRTRISNAGVENQLIVGVPSCAGLQFELTIPKTRTNDWEQAVNMLYKNIRSANAGSTNYSPRQLANYIFTIRSIDAVLSILGRAIKLMNSGSFYDAKSPMAYFAAMGLDYDTFVANAANVRELYNRLCAIRYRLMPLNVTLLDRTRWLFGNVFKDSNDAKAQVYVPNLRRIYTIDSQNNVDVIVVGEDTSAEGTGIQYDKFVDNILETFDIYQNDAIFQIIAGDIQKAYGQASLTKYPEIASNEVLTPVYDEHVLTQIQNASLSITGNVLQTFNVPENVDGFVTSTVVETVSNNILGQQSPLPSQQAEYLNYLLVDPIYNSNENVVDPGKLLSSTRLMASRHAENGPGAADDAYIRYDTYGTEILEEVHVILYAATNSEKYGLAITSIQLLSPTCVINGNSVLGQSPTDVPAWTWFDYFPYVIPYILDIANKVWWFNVPLFDFNNFGIAHKSNLESYNAIATLSMLHKEFISRTSKVEVFEA